ncbi:hypothetical protein NDU88_003688 [Pleurodeles waltl]|uniref:Uncharacterized protein n=1 Tax=Pleurodeles waltl TaxID=8319 RepID=A0AAV7M444_PLEWA|nr:hypothetical protein NDU88_003688 [Pleurodeles waltl]
MLNVRFLVNVTEAEHHDASVSKETETLARSSREVLRTLRNTVDFGCYSAFWKEMEQKKRKGGAEKVREKKRRLFEEEVRENKNIFDMFTMQTKKLYPNACTTAVGSLSSDANILAITLTEHSTCKQMIEQHDSERTEDVQSEEAGVLSAGATKGVTSEEESQISTSVIPAANVEEATESSAKATQVDEPTKSTVSGSSESILLPEAGIQDMTETQEMDQSQIVDVFFQRPRHDKLSEFFQYHPIQPSKSQQFNGQLAFMRKDGSI